MFPRTPPTTDSQLPFANSARSSVGIEWEMGLVDDDNGDMRQAAPAIFTALGAETNHPHIKQEFMQNTVELVSGVCQTVAEAGADLYQAATQVRAVADPMRVGLISAGTHPFSAWRAQKITNSERYLNLLNRAQVIGRQTAIFGVHTHVGVESRAKVLPLLRSMLVYQPYLLALSASSPFWDGKDSGYASMRSVLFQQLPTAGVPYLFDTWEELSSYADDLVNTGVISSFDEVRWDIRPSCQYGTLEVRVCDGISNLKELLALSALTHCLVEDLSEQYDAGGPDSLPVLPPWFITENKWRAARYGLDANVITSPDGSQVKIRNGVKGLVTRLLPTADTLGCRAELENVLEILEIGANYERQRQVQAAALTAGASSHEALEIVVSHLVAEMRADQPLPASYANMWS